MTCTICFHSFVGYNTSVGDAISVSLHKGHYGRCTVINVKLSYWRVIFHPLWPTIPSAVCSIYLFGKLMFAWSHLFVFSIKNTDTKTISSSSSIMVFSERYMKCIVIFHDSTKHTIQNIRCKLHIVRLCISLVHFSTKI